MSTPASPATFTISDTTRDSPAAFPFFILLIDALTMSLSIKQGTPLAVSAPDKVFPSHANFVIKSFHDNIFKVFSYLYHYLPTHHHQFLCTARQ